MSQHFIVTADAGHLRIYEEAMGAGQFTPSLRQVEAMDFPAGRRSYTDRETDMAGRFQASGAPGSGAHAVGRTGMSIDERLPMQREEARRRARDLAAAIDRFFLRRPEASFDFAAGPDLNGAVLDQLAPAVRQRIKRSVAKDLVKQRIDELRAHFSTVA